MKSCHRITFTFKTTTPVTLTEFRAYRLRPICIVEPIIGGHHGWYVQWLIEGLGASNVELLTTRSAIDHSSMKWIVSTHPELQVTPGISERSVVFAHSRPRALWNRWRNARALVQAVKQNGTRGRFHFFPFLDPIAYELGLLPNLLRDVEWSAIFMSPTFHQARERTATGSAKTAIQAVLFRRLLNAAGLHRLFVIDPSLERYSSRRWPLVAAKVSYLHDPISVPEPAGHHASRQSLGLQTSDLAILAYGSLTRRKGVLLLLDAVCCPAWNPLVKIILAGQPDDQVQQRLGREDCKAAAEAGKLILRTRFLSTSEEAVLFSAADYSWLAYLDFFQMSGVLIKSLSYGLPVIANRAGLIGEFVATERSGIFLNSLEPHAIAAQLEALLTDGQFSVEARESLRTRAEDFYVDQASRPVINHIEKCVATLAYSKRAA